MVVGAEVVVDGSRVVEVEGSEGLELESAVDSVSVAAVLDSGSGDASVGAAVVSRGDCSGAAGFEDSGLDSADEVVSWLELSSVVSDA